MKIVIYCAASDGPKDGCYGDNGNIGHWLGEKSGTDVTCLGFNGAFDQALTDPFAEACSDADLVLIDVWVHDSLDENIATQTENKMNAAQLAGVALRANPEAVVLGQQMDTDKFELHPIHMWVSPFPSWRSDVTMEAAKYCAARRSNSQGLEGRQSVLVVDDSFANLAAAEQQLGGEYDVTTAHRYLRARKIMEERTFDMILTDLYMPTECAGLTQAAAEEYGGRLIPVGLPIALQAKSLGVQRIAVVSDGNHHNHPISWALDPVRDGSAGIEYTCRYDDQERKDWREVIRVLWEKN